MIFFLELFNISKSTNNLQFIESATCEYGAQSLFISLNNRQTLFTLTDFNWNVAFGIPLIPNTYGFLLENVRNPSGLKDMEIFVMIKSPSDFVNESAFETIQISQKTIIIEGNLTNEETRLGGVGKYTMYFKTVDLIQSGESIRITLPEELTVLNDSHFDIRSKSFGLEVQDYRILGKNIFELDVRDTIKTDEYVIFEAYNIKNPTYISEGVGTFLIEVVGLNGKAFSYFFRERNDLVFDMYGSGFEVRVDNNFLGNNVTLGFVIFNMKEFSKELNLVVDVDDVDEGLTNEDLKCSGSVNDAVVGVRCQLISKNRVLISEFAVDIPALSEIHLSIKGFKYSNELTTHLLEFHYIAYHTDPIYNLIYEEDDYVLPIELQCHANCLSCIHSFNFCLECKPNYLFLGHQCVACDEQGFVKNNTQCLKCLTDDTCFQCDPDNTEKCKECVNGYFLLNGHCISNSNDIYFEEEDAKIYTCLSSTLKTRDSSLIVSSPINSTKTSYAIVYDNIVFYGDASSNLFYLTGFVLLSLVSLVILKFGVKHEIAAVNFLICLFSLADQICIISLMIKFGLVEHLFYFSFTLVVVVCYYLLHFYAIVRFREIFGKDDFIKLDLVITRIAILDLLVLVLNFRLKLLFSIYTRGSSLSLQEKTKQLFHMMMNKLLRIQVAISFFVVVVISASIFNEMRNERSIPSFFYEYLVFEILFIFIQITKVNSEVRDEDLFMVKEKSRRKDVIDESVENGVCNLASPLGKTSSKVLIYIYQFDSYMNNLYMVGRQDMHFSSYFSNDYFYFYMSI